MEYRNAIYISNTVIDCEINHPIHGWIPFTCDPSDSGAQFDILKLYARMKSDPMTKPYIPPSQEEITVKVAERIRIQRDSILMNEVDPLVSNPLRWNDMNSIQQQVWIDYRRALLDIPQQDGFPHNVIWPTKPA